MGRAVRVRCDSFPPSFPPFPQMHTSAGLGWPPTCLGRAPRREGAMDAIPGAEERAGGSAAPASPFSGSGLVAPVEGDGATAHVPSGTVPGLCHELIPWDRACQTRPSQGRERY